MGLTNSANDEGEFTKSFSDDLLKIQLSGPEHDHFSVIDLPGLFRSMSWNSNALNLDKLTRARANSWTDLQRRHGPCAQYGVCPAQERTKHYTVAAGPAPVWWHKLTGEGRSFLRTSTSPLRRSSKWQKMRTRIANVHWLS